MRRFSQSLWNITSIASGDAKNQPKNHMLDLWMEKETSNQQHLGAPTGGAFGQTDIYKYRTAVQIVSMDENSKFRNESNRPNK